MIDDLLSQSWLIWIVAKLSSFVNASSDNPVAVVQIAPDRVLYSVPCQPQLLGNLSYRQMRPSSLTQSSKSEQNDLYFIS